MSAVTCTAWKMMIWFADRLGAPRLCPLPLSDLRGRIEGLLHSPQGTAVIAAVAVVAAVHGLRSAWFQVHRYGR